MPRSLEKVFLSVSVRVFPEQRLSKETGLRRNRLGVRAGHTHTSVCETDKHLRGSQCRRPQLDPRSGNQIPHVTTKEPESLKENLWCCN